MHHRIALFILLLLILVVPSPNRAQQHSWQAFQELKAGQQVTVVDRQMKTYKGAFVSYTETDLTVRVAGQSIALDRDKVVRVNVTGHHRVRNAVIGLIAGAGVGGAMVACCAERESGFGGAAAGGVIGAAAVGAGIGALFPGSRTVYRSGDGKRSSVSPVNAEPFQVRAE